MISQIETDKILPSADLLHALAARLGVLPEHLLPAKHAEQERLACYQQAQAFLSLGHVTESLPLLLSCLRDPHPTWSEFALLDQIGSCYQQLGEYEQARRYYEQALRLAIRDERIGEAIRLYVRIGEMLHAVGQIELALLEWRRAERELDHDAAPKQEPLFVLALRMHMAGGLRALGELRGALHYYRLAEQSLRGLSGQSRKRAEVQLGIALTFEMMERPAQAEVHVREAKRYYLACNDRRMALYAQILHGRMLRISKRLREARQELNASLQEAEEIGASDLILRASCELGRVRAELGAAASAVSSLRNALDRTNASPKERGLTYLTLANLYEADQQISLAFEAAEQAHRLLQSSREELLPVYRLLIKLCKRQDDYRQASVWAERADQLIGWRMHQHGWWESKPLDVQSRGERNESSNASVDSISDA